MKIGISTCSINHGNDTILDNLEIFKNAGFDILELDAHDRIAFPYNNAGFIRELNVKIDSLGMEIHSFHAPFHNSISDPDPGIRKMGVDEIRKLMECLSPLIESAPNTSGKFLVIHPGHHISRTPVSEQFQNCLGSLKKILDSPLSSRFHICIENMLSSHFGGKSSELLELVARLNNRISICLDTSHSVYDSAPEQFLEDVFGHLATTHISDNYNQSHGEFHAIPMTLKHSRINWRHFFHRVSQRLDRIILELNKPPFIGNAIYMEMAAVAMKQVERY